MICKSKTPPWAAKILRFLDLKIVICKGKMPPEAEKILRFVDIKIGICKGKNAAVGGENFEICRSKNRDL